jgi:hypothetical protein
MSQWRLLHTLDVNFLRHVAHNRKLLHSLQRPTKWLPLSIARFSQRYSALTGNSCERCRKLTFAGEKLRVSAVQSSITCLLSITALAIHLPYSNREMNGIHPLEKKIFCHHKNPRENPIRPRKKPIRLPFSVEKWFRFRVYGGQTIHDVPALEMSGYANKHLSLHALAVVYRPGLA